MNLTTKYKGECFMKEAWYSIITKVEQDKSKSLSFIGGKPHIPPNEPLPCCKICGKPLTFFFQIAYPEGHFWEGKSMAFFFCSAYQQHDSKEKLPKSLPILKRNHFDIDMGLLEPESYQTMFRTIIFDTVDGVERNDYEEKVLYQEIEWKKTKRKNKKAPMVIGGDPIWIGKGKYGEEMPDNYNGKPMDLVLQIAENYNFEKKIDAPPELERVYFKPTPFMPREKDYTLFFDFNRVFIWGTVDRENPRVYINVQNNI